MATPAARSAQLGRTEERSSVCKGTPTTDEQDPERRKSDRRETTNPCKPSPNTRPYKGSRNANGYGMPWQLKMQQTEQRTREVRANLEELSRLEEDFPDLAQGEVDAERDLPLCLDLPPKSKAQSADAAFVELLLRNLRIVFQKNAVKTRTDVAQKLVDGLSLAIFSSDMKEQNLINAGSRVLGVDIRRQFSRAMIIEGNISRAACSAKVATSIPRAPAVAAMDLDFVYEYFHQFELYTADKSRPKQRMKMTRFIAGKERQIRCQPALLNGTKKDAVAAFWKSAEYLQWLKLPFAKPLSERQVAKCICSCMKEEDIRECQCTYCTTMKCLHKAFAALWTQAKSEVAACVCGSCAVGKPFRKASASVSALVDQVTCPAVAYPDLALPHQRHHHPHFRRVRCCAKPRRNKKGHLVGYFPVHVTEKCTDCGWKLLDVKSTCVLVDPTKQVRWLEYQDTESKDGSRVRPVLRYKIGTRKELVEGICKYLEVYLLHKWVHHWMYHQMQLDIATFGRGEIRVSADYAATAELKAKDMKTCETPTTANQLVALVLHSPQEQVGQGKPRAVECDYWRMWTNAKANCQGWHVLLLKIAQHYKKQRVGVWTDGSSTQFKGGKNFMLNVLFFQKHGIELFHNFPATAHGGGPVDNAGKQPRALIRADEKFERSRVYDYDYCLRWCRTH
jgi:hypothetical protein